jgi:hypothetical protein
VAGGEVALALQHGQAHQRLDTTQIYAPAAAPIAVVEDVFSIEIISRTSQLNEYLST